MINTPQDYQLVTPVGVIDGGILPARDVAGDGSVHALRTEDMCFAIEAVKERNFRQISSSGVYAFPSPTHLTRVRFMRDVFYDWNLIWGMLRSVCFESSVRAIDPYEQFAPTPYTQSYSFGLANFYPSAFLASCHVSDITSYVLDNAFWRRFYFDLKRADRLCVNGGSLYHLGSWSATGTYTDQAGNTYQVLTSDIGNITSTSRVAYIHAIGYNYRNGAYHRVTYGTSNCTMTRTSLPDIGKVVSAVAVVAYQLSVTGAGESVNSDYYFARGYPCTITPAGVVVDPSMFLSSGFDIVTECESLGHNFPAEASSMKGGYASVVIRATYLVANYNFRTEIRSLNWNWAP